MYGQPNYNFNYNFNFNGTVPTATLIGLIKDRKTDEEIAAITGEKPDVIKKIRNKLKKKGKIK